MPPPPNQSVQPVEIDSNPIWRQNTIRTITERRARPKAGKKASGGGAYSHNAERAGKTIMADVRGRETAQGAVLPRRKSPAGESTSDLICSAHLGANEQLFPQVLALHVPRGATVADVTYGKGVFWKGVERGAYNVLATDIATGVDCRDLPYEDESIDCVVLDPPYMEGFYRRAPGALAGGGTHSAFRRAYSNGAATPSGPRYHAAVIDMYLRAGGEAFRVLKPHGVFILKCQDEVSANRQHFTHVELINEFTGRGFYAKDLFVLVRTNRPAVSRILRQQHARKNHSYFLVFIKTNGQSPRRKR